MIKDFITVFFLCLILSISVAFLNSILITQPLRFSLNAIYAYHGIAALIVYALVAITYKNLPNQAGYAYLTTVFIKMGVFVLVFKNSVFSIDVLSKEERLSLIIPLFIFLILEAIFVSKLLNKKPH
ncbi:DUF6168 family protein [Lacinutrix salivirga]